MNKSIVVRKAGIADIEALKPLKEQIHNIHVDGNSKHFRKFKDSEIDSFFTELFKQENTVAMAAQIDGRIAGYIVLIHFKRDARPGHNSRNVLVVDEICVDEKIRGEGIGKKLMQSAMDTASELGADSIELGVWDFNIDAIGFYEHMGMKKTIARYSIDL